MSKYGYDFVSYLDFLVITITITSEAEINVREKHQKKKEKERKYCQKSQFQVYPMITGSEQLDTVKEKNKTISLNMLRNL